MKKLVTIFTLILSLTLVACGKRSADDVVGDLQKKANDLKGYHLVGVMEIYNNEETYKYDIQSSFSKDDLYKVSLKNQFTNQEQIILKNNEGVFVLTPALNKSFKFQSEWPYNNSQAYIYQSIVNDIVSDKDREFKKVDDNYVFTVKANYPNNQRAVKQMVTMDKKLNPVEVVVVDENGNPIIKVSFSSVDFNAKFDEAYFSQNDNMKVARTNLEGSVPVVNVKDNVLYPLYVPENTFLKKLESVQIASGDRVILTFDGDKPFTVIEEKSMAYDITEVMAIYGEPVELAHTVAAMTESSISWDADGMRIYVVSDSLTEQEMFEIAQSMSPLQAK